MLTQRRGGAEEAPLFSAPPHLCVRFRLPVHTHLTTTAAVAPHVHIPTRNSTGPPARGSSRPPGGTRRRPRHQRAERARPATLRLARCALSQETPRLALHSSFR